jgi:type III restriction enzyme
MLQEAKDLQQRAVAELVRKADGSKRELTFRAPTGSGKTRMMADFMNRVLGTKGDVVFLVSTLSKGGLAEQNYDVFRDCADKGVFTKIDPWLISTEVSGEKTLFIPVDHNVYVLPRDLYKKNGRLMQGAMLNFLQTLTESYFGQGMKKKIWLIKDECHQATNNLDDLSEKHFQRVINFSATPNLKRGQVPDVQITDEEAVQARLIKQVELEDDETIPVDAAIDKFLEIRRDYNNLLQTHPCLIIQISNKDKAQTEWERRVKPAIDKHQELKWMLIVNKDKDCDTNDDVKRRLPVSRWKDYAKGKDSTIDVIVFKMVISEGWDIPRACMLYQVRDTQSKQLDEQVMGRVRRNPRLLDFETLSTTARDLAMTAWVWGVKPEAMKKTRQVKLWESQQTDIRQHVRVTTTRLTNLTERADFDVSGVVESKPVPPVSTSIFKLWNKLQQCPNDVQTLCYQYANGDVQRWWRFMEMADEVRRKYDNYICDYDESMEVDKTVSFPLVSSYVETDQSERIRSWVWCRKDGSGHKFTFDSEAEREWASVLMDCEDDMAVVSDYDLFDDKERCLWGKNFPTSSEIKYEYYADGIHSSYPDFIMKDKAGRIHVFEVKSVNKASGQNIDPEEYNQKIGKLKDCYLHCSKKLRNHIFYLPILKDDWQIFRYEDGKEDQISEKSFKESLKKAAGIS